MTLTDIHIHNSDFIKPALFVRDNICDLLEKEQINLKNEILYNSLTVSLQALSAIQTFLKTCEKLDYLDFYVSPIKLLIRNVSIYQLDVHYLISKENNQTEFNDEINNLKNEGLNSKLLFNDNQIQSIKNNIKDNLIANIFFKSLEENQDFIKHKNFDSSSKSLKKKFLHIISVNKFKKHILMHIWFNYSHYSKITHQGFFTNIESQKYEKQQLFNDICMIFYSIIFILENFDLNIDYSELSKRFNYSKKFSDIYNQ